MQIRTKPRRLLLSLFPGQEKDADRIVWPFEE